MKIEIGKVYNNKSLKYLLPKLRKHYDPMLINYLHSVGIMAVGIGDFFLKEDLSQHLFILIDAKYNKKVLSSMMKYVSNKDYFEKDYAYDNIFTGQMQMLVLKLPDDVIDKFIKGQYSQLYSFNEALEIVKDTSTFDVIIKAEHHKVKFIEQIANEFKGDGSPPTLTLEEIGDRELDIPPKKKEEIFNYRE